MVDDRGFNPDWISPPGDTIADVLDEQGLSLVEFARRIGQPTENADELLRGTSMITVEVARRLEAVLGGSAAFWMIREAQYRDDTNRLTKETSESDTSRWLYELPLKDMARFGWINPIQSTSAQVEECLRFFDVPDPSTWRKKYRDALEMAVFRTSPSFESQPGAVAAWLRQAEIEGEQIDCKEWNSRKFREALSSIRALTRKKDPRLFIPELRKMCSESGVAVVVVRSPSGCRASGATRFLSSNKALLVLSFRYLADDQFWFTFFHEAGHLVLHDKRALFLEGPNMSSTKEEQEANDFAAEILIPQEFQKLLLGLGVDAYEVIKFARRVGVSPGIVVGQLQYAGRIGPRQLNPLKRRYRWDDSKK